MASVLEQPRVTADDRLALTIVIAILIHAMIVLGISFAPERGTPARYESLEVILVPERSTQAPEQARVLAQANLEGGGDQAEAARPATPVKAPLPSPEPTIAAPPPPPTQAVEAPPPKQPPVTPKAQGRAPVKEKVARPAPRGDVAAPKAKEAAPAKEVTEEPTPPTPAPQKAVEAEPLPTAAQLLTRSFSSALIDAEIQDKLDTRAQRPRRKYVSAATREYKFANYMEGFRAKVERLGNINYPEKAREQHLSGDLLLDVALNPDGTVKEITVRRSSGFQVLDDAAIRIVQLAAPYAPFPPDIRKTVDELHITRTWKFKDETVQATQD